MKKHELSDDIFSKWESERGDNWLGMTLAVVVGLAVAIIIVELLFGDVLHYWLADMIV